MMNWINRNWEPIAVTLCAIAMIAIIAAVSGCQAETKSTFAGHRDVRISVDGVELSAIRKSETAAAAKADPNAAAPTTQAVGFDGTSTSIGQEHAPFPPDVKPLAAYGLEQRALIFYGGSALMGIAAVVGLILGYKSLAVGVGAGAVAMGLFPTLIDSYGPFLVGVGVLATIVGIVVWAVGVWNRRRENAATKAVADQYAAKGDYDAAYAAVESAPAMRKK